MKKLIIISFLLFAIVVKAQIQVESIPDWYNNPPVSSRKHYGAGVGSSKTLDIAEQKARLDANVKLAEQVEPSNNQEIETVLKDKEGKPVKGIIQRKTVEARLSGVKLVKKLIIQDGDQITVYVLLEMNKKK